MHELKFIKTLVDDLVDKAGQLGAKRITRVYLKMGEFTEINPEIVEFYISKESGIDLLKDCKVVVKPLDGHGLVLESFDYE